MLIGVFDFVLWKDGAKKFSTALVDQIGCPLLASLPTKPAFFLSEIFHT